MQTNGAHCVAVLGHFTGVQPGGMSRFLDVDRDLLDTVLDELGPKIELDFDFCPELALHRWRDFHPDSIIERIPALAHLMEARRAVGNDSRMRDALARAGVAPPAVDTQAVRGASEQPVIPPAASGGDLLDSMLGDAASERGPATRPGDGFDAAILEIVESSRDHRDVDAEAQARDAIDDALARRLRAVLWHPAFRRLEQSWSGLRALVRAAPTDDALRFVVADFPQERFAAELGAESSALEALLASERGIPPKRCDVVVTDWVFDASVDAMRQLARLGEIADRLGLVVLARAAGSATAVQDASEAQLAAWNELQRRSGSRRIGLVAPRLLARLPYGAAADPIDAFDFEEGARADHPEELSWTSGAFALASALARAIATTGRPSDIVRHVELEDLPMFVEGSGPDARVCGPVEEQLTETLREANRLMGILPITGVAGSDRAVLLGLESLACQPLFPGG